MLTDIFMLIELIPQIIAIASMVCALTPTPKDDAILGKVYKILELLALNIGKAKMPNK
jgi:hypothetical protein